MAIDELVPELQGLVFDSLCILSYDVLLPDNFDKEWSSSFLFHIRIYPVQAGIGIHINHRRDHKLTRRIIFPVEVVIVVVITPSLKIGSIIHALGKSIAIFVPWLSLGSSLVLTIISFIIIILPTSIIASSTIIVIVLSLVVRLETSFWLFLQLFNNSFFFL